ncbi:MAG: hypothetical protein LBF08_06040 [Dysgonamonadaceae bacterium]|jgi:mRNA-degrading endonuclease RelE of RelBE toxin-antitoxin system|nr:hypothetical protein [Dysgonamonadaceae bacterium]
MYEVIISDRAQRGIDKIPTKYAKAIMDAILGLAAVGAITGIMQLCCVKNVI